MKLLSSRETENNTTLSATAEAERIMNIRSQLSREEHELNLKKKQFEEELIFIQADFDGKIFTLNDKLSVLEKEVDILEAQRTELLRPLDDFSEKIKENLASTDELLTYLGKRKKEVAKQKEELVKWKEDLKTESETIYARGERILAEEKELNEKKIELQQQEERINLSAESMAQNASRKQMELSLFEGSLRKKEVELAEREKLVAEDKEKIIQDRKHLESQQQTLIAAYKEAKNKLII